MSISMLSFSFLAGYFSHEKEKKMKTTATLAIISATNDLLSHTFYADITHFTHSMYASLLPKFV